MSLGETTVSCEGYDYPGIVYSPLNNQLEDPYILAGSCGVEFYLNKNGDFYKTKHQPHYSYSATHPFHWYNPFHWIASFFDSFGTVLRLHSHWLVDPSVLCCVCIHHWTCWVEYHHEDIVILCFLFHFSWTFMKILLFPLYLMSCCCCHGCSGPQYAYYVPPPPPVYNVGSWLCRWSIESLG